MCGFGDRRQLREHIEHIWRVKRNKLINHDVDSSSEWVRYGNLLSINLRFHKYGIKKLDLILVCLSKQ